MKKTIYIISALCMIIIILVLILFIKNTNVEKQEENIIESKEETRVVSSEKIKEEKKEINIYSVDGSDTKFEFEYNGEIFSAIYTKDNWKIVNSYKISNREDMKQICQALIDIYPIHGRDMVSYREADDMVREWVQHNFAYEILSEDNQYKINVRDVDFNPEDQGKNIIEMYTSRKKKR